MTILERIYASAPTEAKLLSTVEVCVPGRPPLRFVADYLNRWLGVDGNLEPFEGINLEVALPSNDTSGRQVLSFAVSALDGRARQYVSDALESGERVRLIFREYLASAPEAPVRRPYVMTLVGGSFDETAASFQAAYYDLLNTAWPTERYTSETAPGIAYL